MSITGDRTFEPLLREVYFEVTRLIWLIGGEIDAIRRNRIVIRCLRNNCQARHRPTFQGVASLKIKFLVRRELRHLAGNGFVTSLNTGQLEQIKEPLRASLCNCFYCLDSSKHSHKGLKEISRQKGHKKARLTIVKPPIIISMRIYNTRGSTVSFIVIWWLYIFIFFL